MTTKAQLHALVDALPDDGEKLEAVREWIAERLAAWHAAGRIAQERGWDVEERHTKSGSVIRDRRADASPPRPAPPLESVEELCARLGAERILITDPDHWQAEYAGGRLEPLDPMLQALYSAPLDDEPLTDEERAAIEEARADLARGETEPWEQVRADLLGPR